MTLIIAWILVYHLDMCFLWYPFLFVLWCLRSMIVHGD
jgi:hypothetical protein